MELKEKVSMKNYGIPKNNNFHCFLKVRGARFNYADSKQLLIILRFWTGI